MGEAFLMGQQSQGGINPNGNALEMDVVFNKTFSNENGIDKIGILNVEQGSYLVSKGGVNTNAINNNTWNSICYGNGLFVAVAISGTGNRVMTSPDGRTWVSRTSAADSMWNSVCYGNGLFVAVNAGGLGENGEEVMTSPDGITWTLQSTPVNYSWRSVCYGNGLFVAVSAIGTGNRVMTSQDGINWTSRTSAADSMWNSVCYGNGLFVAVAESSLGNHVMTSPDGINWTLRATNSVTDNTWKSVCYGNGLFVAVSSYSENSENSVMTSPDGTNWTLRSTPSGYFWNSVCYGNGLFMAVTTSGSGGGRKMTSIDGINWVQTTPGVAYYWNSVCYGNNLFVVVGYSSTASRVVFYEYTREEYPIKKPSVIKLNDFELIGVSKNTHWQSVCYGNRLFVAVTSYGTGNRAITSSDGRTWASRTSAADNYWESVCYGNGLFVGVSSSGTGNRVMTSPDGITWTLRTSAADNQWTSVCYGNGLFVAVAESGIGNRVMTSSNGTAWTLRTSAANIQWRSVCYGNGLFVAVAISGTGNRVMTSPDGITWTSRTSAANNYWNSVCYCNGLFVAVASSGTNDRIMVSSDGINWITRTIITDNQWNSVCYGNGLVVAVANYNATGSVMIAKTLREIVDYKEPPLLAKGDSVASDVLIGKIFSNDNNSGLVGTMPNNPAQSSGEVKTALVNLISNSSFESGITEWSVGTESAVAKYGSKSIALIGSPSTVEVTSQRSITIPYVQGHKYYVSWWARSTVGGISSEVYFPLVSPYVSGVITCTNVNQWYFGSFISENASIASGNVPVRIDNNNLNVSNNMYFDGLTIIDLTVSFGAGNEPTKETMNSIMTSIGGWFDKSTILVKIPNGAYVNNGITGSPEILVDMSTTYKVKSITYTGTYANATYFTEAGTKLLYGANNEVGVTIQGGTSTGYENIIFTLTDNTGLGITLLQPQTIYYSASGSVGGHYTAILMGVTSPINISCYFDAINATYDTVRCAMTATLAS